MRNNELTASEWVQLIAGIIALSILVGLAVVGSVALRSGHSPTNDCAQPTVQKEK